MVSSTNMTSFFISLIFSLNCNDGITLRIENLRHLLLFLHCLSLFKKSLQLALLQNIERDQAHNCIQWLLGKRIEVLRFTHISP